MRGRMLSFRIGVGLAALALTAVPTPGETSAAAEAEKPVVVLAQVQPQPRPPARGSAPSRPPAKDEAAAGRPAGDAQLRERVEQLEQQLSEMQIVLGTLESFARSPAPMASAMPASRGSFPAGGDQGRIEDLETQVRALSNQLQQLSEQVRQLGGRRTDAGGGSALAGREALASPRLDTGSPQRTDGAVGQSAPAADPQRGTAGGNFGSLTVTPGPDRDPIGRLITREPGAQEDRLASATTDAAHVGNPKELYETAYGYLLQQDYASAETSFEEFLRLYPTDRLAPDAQYWLGEAFYVQRRYKPAGQAFLKVIQNHQSSAKVPNSLLKLAMTLEQLGQKDCALFNELETRHSNAPADVKNRARVVRQRVGC